jgi:hypothetical protein
LLHPAVLKNLEWKAFEIKEVVRTIETPCEHSITAIPCIEK